MSTSDQSPPPPWASWYESVRRPAGAADLRVSDAERNAMADLLAKHYGDGRLDDEEFKARIDRAMSAKTRSDFLGLTDDLPRLETEGSVPLPRRRHRYGLMRVPGVLLVVVLTIWIVSWSMSSIFFAPHVPWLLIAIVGLLLWRHHSRRAWHNHHHHHHSHSAPPPFG
jgi:hypothetical protein